MKRKKQKFVSSCEIMELEEFHAMQAKSLISKLRNDLSQNVFMELDCIPNGNLNAFNYGNGLKSMELIKNLAGTLLRNELPEIESKIYSAKNSKIETDFTLGAEVGLWEKIDVDNYQEKLNWNKAFCIKNAKGLTKIWHPDWRRLGYKNGFSTRSAVISFIHSQETYLQKFYLPLPVPSSGPAWRMYYRLVFFAAANKIEPELMGGLWISSPGFKIYSSENSQIGLISPLTVADCFI